MRLNVVVKMKLEKAQNFCPGSENFGFAGVPRNSSGRGGA